MADATTIVKTNPTNVQWVHCGPPDPQVKELLASLSRKAKNSRIEWLKDMCMKSLPSGPYPFHVDGRGWFKGHIFDNQRYQVCYVIRKDLNLDVQVFESIRDRGDVVERRLVKDADRRIRIRVCKPELWAAYKELYPKEFTKIHAYWEFADVTVQSLLALIEVEGRLWKEYDAEANGSLELMKKVQAGPAQCEVICRGVAEDKVILEAMKKDAKASDEAFVSDLQKRALAVDKEIKKKRPKAGQSLAGPNVVFHSRKNLVHRPMSTHHTKGPKCDLSASLTRLKRGWMRSTSKSAARCGSSENWRTRRPSVRLC